MDFIEIIYLKCFFKKSIEYNQEEIIVHLIMATKPVDLYGYRA